MGGGLGDLQGLPAGRVQDSRAGLENSRHLNEVTDELVVEVDRDEAGARAGAAGRGRAGTGEGTVLDRAVVPLDPAVVGPADFQDAGRPVVSAQEGADFLVHAAGL